MEYLKHIHIKNFRGISDLQYNPKQVNVIIGKNNAGKSTILDAIKYSVSHKVPFDNEKYYYDIKAGFTAAEISSDSSICHIYLNKDVVPANLLKAADEYLRDKIHAACVKLGISEEKCSEIEVQISNILPYYIAEFNGVPQIRFDVEKILNADSKVTNALMSVLNTLDVSKKSMQTTFAETGLVSDYVSEPDYSQVSPSKLRSQRNRVFQFIFNLFDAISNDDDTKVSVIPYASNEDCGPVQITDSLRLIQLEKIIKEYAILSDVERLTNEGVVYQTSDNLVMIPYSCHGAGFVTLLNLIDKLYSAKNGVFLIEEPENHMHPGYLSVFVEQIVKLAVNLNVQVFMTTHSADLIEEFANYSDSSSQEEELIQIASVIKRDDGHEVYVYSPSEALQMMNDLLIDLRGA